MDIGRIERIIEIERIDEVVPVKDPQPAPPLVPDAVPVRAPPTRSHRSSGTGLGRWGSDNCGLFARRAGSAGRGRSRCGPPALGTASPAGSIPADPITSRRIDAVPAASMRSSLGGIWSLTNRTIRGRPLPDGSKDGGGSPWEKGDSGPNLHGPLSFSPSCGGRRPLSALQRAPHTPTGSGWSHGRRRRRGARCPAERNFSRHPGRRRICATYRSPNRC